MMAAARLLGPAVLVLGVLIVALTTLGRVPRQERWVNDWLNNYRPVAPLLTYDERMVLDEIARHALDRANVKGTYDPSYVPIPYPGGDVAADKGVCTDEVIRVLRKVGIDLQRGVHEDKVAHLRDYPFLWFQFRADPNIDHRRVPNLMFFMKRKGVTLPLSPNPRDYLPGEIVAWDLGNGLLHIGITVARYSNQGAPLILHNIGAGPQLEDVLFRWKILGHFRLTRL